MHASAAPLKLHNIEDQAFSARRRARNFPWLAARNSLISKHNSLPLSPLKN
jgi:hypothetical protein